jgi:hypothetical protein
MTPTVFELGEQRLLAAEHQEKARRQYEAIRRSLDRRDIDSDTDSAAMAALAVYEHAQARYEEARRAHGIALADDLKAREQATS